MSFITFEVSIELICVNLEQEIMDMLEGSINMSRTCDLINMEFGNLKVVERTEKREDGYYVWRCQCKCGGMIDVNTKHLRRHTVTNCGCIPESTARRGNIAEDLTGQHFGEWEVLYRAENRNERVMWVCKCSCGTIRTISARDLKMGNTHSCQKSIHNNPRRRRDLTGKVFGGLRVLYPTTQRDYKGSVIWYCCCLKCGRKKKFSEDILVHGNYKSCGCEQYRHGKELAKYLHHYNGTTLEAIVLNRKVRSDSKTGVIGVHEHKNGGYYSTITFQGKRYYLGKYSTLEKAAAAYRNAKEILHGNFIKAYNAWMESDKDKELIFNVDCIKGKFYVESNYLTTKMSKAQ